MGDEHESFMRDLSHPSIAVAALFPPRYRAVGSGADIVSLVLLRPGMKQLPALRKAALFLGTATVELPFHAAADRVDQIGA
jgi:hypothetical protein